MSYFLMGCAVGLVVGAAAGAAWLSLAVKENAVHAVERYTNKTSLRCWGLSGVRELICADIEGRPAEVEPASKERDA